MENASKALLMAAGVLIGILILSLAVYLFTYFGSASAEIHKQNEENQINQFNSKFTSYAKKEGVTIYDVITVANLATENNIKYEFDKRTGTSTQNDNYICVKLKNNQYATHTRIEFGVNSTSKNITDTYNEIIAKDIQNMHITSDINKSDLNQYDCKVNISEITRKSL